MFRTKIALGLSVALISSGCGVREIVSPDGTTNREIFVGAVHEVDCTQSPGHSARLLQIGAWASGNNAGLGFQRARYFCGGGECQITLWADDADAEELEKFAAKYHGVCIANKEGN